MKVETAIWLTEVAPKLETSGKKFREHLAGASAMSNPELFRIALKLATRTGKTTVTAVLIAWQTVNAVRHTVSMQLTRGFLVVAPGLTDHQGPIARAAYRWARPSCVRISTGTALPA